MRLCVKKISRKAQRENYISLAFSKPSIWPLGDVNTTRNDRKNNSFDHPIDEYPPKHHFYMNQKTILRSECKTFNELTAPELYKILQLRNEVFVVEQQCVFQDADDNDQLAYHLMEWENEKLVAYARLFAPGIVYKEASIGRIVSAPAYRKRGIGKQLMNDALQNCIRLFGPGDLKISAQWYLKAFYESFEFIQVSDIYLDDNIKHILMCRYNNQ